jgi:hypothetical protein
LRSVKYSNMRRRSCRRGPARPLVSAGTAPAAPRRIAPLSNALAVPQFFNHCHASTRPAPTPTQGPQHRKAAAAAARPGAGADRRAPAAQGLLSDRRREACRIPLAQLGQIPPVRTAGLSRGSRIGSRDFESRGAAAGLASSVSGEGALPPQSIDRSCPLPGAVGPTSLLATGSMRPHPHLVGPHAHERHVPPLLRARPGDDEAVRPIRGGASRLAEPYLKSDPQPILAAGESPIVDDEAFVALARCRTRSATPESHSYTSPTAPTIHDAGQSSNRLISERPQLQLMIISGRRVAFLQATNDFLTDHNHLCVLTSTPEKPRPGQPRLATVMTTVVPALSWPLSLPTSRPCTLYSVAWIPSTCPSHPYGLRGHMIPEKQVRT